MSKSTKKAAEQAEREKVQRRYANRREPDVIYPAKKQVDFYDDDVHQRVAVYVRVSTDNLGQETSYELQKNYYEEFVLKHPNWELVKIYADKGISGTSTRHRDELNQMLTDCRAGKIDLIITKSVSRLARNTVDCITMVRNLAELRNPVGVFFESECIFSLNEDKAVVSHVVIGVGHGHVEHDPPPQLLQISLWISTVGFEEGHQFKIARAVCCRSTIRLPQHCHGRCKVDSGISVPVESPHKESASVLGEVDQHGLWNIQTTKSCEVVGNLFPSAHIDIVMFGGKLGNPQVSLCIQNGSLWPCAT